MAAKRVSFDPKSVSLSNLFTSRSHSLNLTNPRAVKSATFPSSAGRMTDMSVFGPSRERVEVGRVEGREGKEMRGGNFRRGVGNLKIWGGVNWKGRSGNFRR